MADADNAARAGQSATLTLCFTNIVSLAPSNAMVENTAFPSMIMDAAPPAAM